MVIGFIKEQYDEYLMTQRHGPQKRRTIVENELQDFVTSGKMKNWISAEEIANEIDKKIPGRWRSCSAQEIASRMQKHLKSGSVVKKIGNHNSKGYLIWFYHNSLE